MKREPQPAYEPANIPLDDLTLPPAPAITREAAAELIFTALGEASMCWNPRPTGEFDSTRATRIGEKLITQLGWTPRKDNSQ